MSALTPTPIPHFVYLNLPVAARGGALRFFMLCNEIGFTEEVIEMSDWPDYKAELIKSGDNPAGGVPIVRLGGKVLTQHVATMRYLSHINDKSSGDIYGDYVQDLVADEYANWRMAWVEAAFKGGDKEVYKSTTLATTLAVMEGYYAKYKTGESPYLSTSPAGAGLWGDAVVAGTLLDHIHTDLLDMETLSKYENLTAMFKAYVAQPPVAEWIAAHEAKMNK